MILSIHALIKIPQFYRSETKLEILERDEVVFVILRTFDFQIDQSVHNFLDVIKPYMDAPKLQNPKLFVQLSERTRNIVFQAEKNQIIS